MPRLARVEQRSQLLALTEAAPNLGEGGGRLQLLAISSTPSSCASATWDDPTCMHELHYAELPQWAHSYVSLLLGGYSPWWPGQRWWDLVMRFHAY